MSQTLPEIIKQCYRDKTEQGSRRLFRFIIMLTLLAESKTMMMTQNPVSQQEYESGKPIFEDMAAQIMDLMASMNPSELSEILGISQQLAVKAHNLAYDFPHKQTGCKAIYAFIGDAYRGLDIKSIPSEKLDDINSQLRIVSSVYGLLKPDDIIKPYRCEFNKQVAPDKKTPIQFFKSKATIELVNYIKENKINDIIDLLPGDADKCLDWKIIRAFCKVHKVCFQVMGTDGKLKTPIAKRLKELRGLMFREILQNNIGSFADLTKIESPDFIFSPQDSKPLLPVFIAAE